MRNRVWSIAPAVLCLVWGASAQAHSATAPLAPKPITPLVQHGRHNLARGVELMIYSQADADHAWRGYGDATRTISLCIVSSTGRYRLHIVSQHGGAADGAIRVPFTITFTDGLGAQQTASTQRTPDLFFTGSAAPGASCLSGPNASVAVTMDEHSLLAGVAGTYADRLQFAVDTQ